MARTILVIDDERNMRWVLERALTKAGYDVVTAARGEQALQQFARHAVDLVMLDLKLPGMDGMTILRELRQRDKSTPILLLTAYATVPTAVEALQIGANDYLRKPFDIETVLATINRHLAQAGGTAAARVPLSSPNPFAAFVGAAPALHSVLERARTATDSPYPVLLRGEQGTGRRHLARLIHAGTPETSDKRLVELDCANLPGTVLAYELLSQPTDDDSGGRWQQALGGTLLLSNVHRLSDDLSRQAVELLRSFLLSNQQPHGLRLILTAADELPDAWARIADVAFDIRLPPLRERSEDISLLARHFAPDARWEGETLAHLHSYDWPGNVSEFQRVVEQAAFLAADGPVKIDHLPGQLLAADSHVAGIFVLPPEGIELDAVEEDLIRQALDMAGGNKTRAAGLLGLSRATLLYRISKYEIPPADTAMADTDDAD